mmetsp:Transcript_38235/g.108070  ORF Transcript_38235/g.108070 Transcript_38235/m.108070 type:complete len:236 (+) Transcript_38235:139-846(+)|eukprot:CAMPEP_0117656710 /NCGR_PEP_ID=MMETSP0804-20121206/4948_1 /TAXON_ID=1074897 /ORGANISM="Tetraselmis astigmatica, Strain CCMP880" /LENGTH=235 /DNA_ID=CAMNT_0005463127 /DNA_START=106 /DNA_END=813 /DNA_ORIENTATION=-
MEGAYPHSACRATLVPGRRVRPRAAGRRLSRSSLVLVPWLLLCCTGLALSEVVVSPNEVLPESLVSVSVFQAKEDVTYSVSISSLGCEGEECPSPLTATASGSAGKESLELKLQLSPNHSPGSYELLVTADTGTEEAEGLLEKKQLMVSSTAAAEGSAGSDAGVAAGKAGAGLSEASVVEKLPAKAAAATEGEEPEGDFEYFDWEAVFSIFLRLGAMVVAAFLVTAVSISVFSRT